MASHDKSWELWAMSRQDGLDAVTMKRNLVLPATQLRTPASAAAGSLSVNHRCPFEWERRSAGTLDHRGLCSEIDLKYP